MTLISVADLLKAEAELYHAYGRAMAQWAMVERALFLWFVQVTGLPEQMARAVFYSARSFSGRSEMLQAALSAAALPTSHNKFMKASLSKAVTYNTFRNSMAHGEPDVHMGADGLPTGRIHLIQGRLTAEEAAETAITTRRLNAAADSFGELSRLMRDALETAGRDDEDWLSSSPKGALEKVEALPNPPDSETPSQKQLARQGSRTGPSVRADAHAQGSRSQRGQRTDEGR